jgi:hypothetical protein
MSQNNRSSRWRNHCRKVNSAFERLENRLLLAGDGANVFATFDGTITSAGGSDSIPISLTSANFNLSNGRVILGFQLEASGNSALHPAAVQVRNSAGNLVQPIFTTSKLANGTESLSVDQLVLGTYTLTASAQAATSGAYHLAVFLAGDANGDRSVNAADLTVIKNTYGSKAGDGKYLIAADSNLDSLISSFDLAEAITNQADSTNLNPLTTSIALTPAPTKLASGTLVTNSAQAAVSGVTEPGATVQLGTGSDTNFGEGTTTADSSGHYSFSVTLTPGVNPIETQSTDAFGQSRIASIQVTLDTTAPTIAVANPTNGEFTNTNINVAGIVTDDLSGVASLTAQIDGGATFSVSFDSAGNFSFATALALDGTADGRHTVGLVTTDGAGNVGTDAIQFTLKTVPPAQPVFALAAADRANGAPFTTSNAHVTLTGQTDPSVTLKLAETGASAASTNTGAFQFPGVSLAPGNNTLTVIATDLAGNSSQYQATIHFIQSTGASVDQVIFWNQAQLQAIVNDATTPEVASRGLAMVSAAVYDAVNSIDGTPGYYVALKAPADASADAAVASAAYTVLSYLYPAQVSNFNSLLATALAGISDGQPKTDGMAVGQSVANAIIAMRVSDGSTNFVDYTPNTAPGDWQPTAPMFMPAENPQWATLKPFAMTSDNQFRPGPPPALTSQEYATDVNLTLDLGAANSTTRTADETQIAKFWKDGAGTYTPPGHWNAIAEQVAQQQGDSLAQDARLFAELNIAEGDAAIVAWDAKFTYNTWRPISLAGGAGTAVNNQIETIANWRPLITTPPFPEYISGHSTFSGAAAAILTAVFGDNFRFSTTSLSLPGVSRAFTSFEQAANEAGISRIYGGIHFLFSDTAGLTAGAGLGAYVLQTFSTSVDHTPPTITFTNPVTGSASSSNITITGTVLDNLSGVQSLLAQIDGGAFAPVSFDAQGNFSLATTFATDGTADGTHVVGFQATDFAANTSAVQAFSFTLDTQAPTITLIGPSQGDSLTAGAQVTGTADGTGSALVALSYAIDGGAVMPMVFDRSTGAFDETLDLSKLEAGSHTLVLAAKDAAGNAAQSSLEFSMAAAIPLTVSSFTPADGSSDVGVTIRPEVFFSRPIDVSTLNSGNFFATDPSGNVLHTNIVPAVDGTFAWLFFTSPVPGASTITVHVDGSTILASDGTRLDAAGNGTLGSELSWTYSTVNLAGVAGTSIAGTLADPGPDLKPGTIDDVKAGPDGVLMTGDDVFLNPIANVKVYIIGLEDQAVFTDASGNFELDNIPTGDVKLVVDGLTATNSPAGFYYPEMVMDLHIFPGIQNTVMAAMETDPVKAQTMLSRGVYLPRLQTSLLHNVSSTDPTTVGVYALSAPNLTTAQSQFLSLKVQPNSILGADGLPLANPQIGISTVDPQFVQDMLPPEFQFQHQFEITIQAPGATVFNTPVAITFPNLQNAPPGTKVNVMSFDHTTGLVVPDGTATVSADGLYVVSDPGSGIRAPGWHFMQVGTGVNAMPCTSTQCVVISVQNGDDAYLGNVIRIDLNKALPNGAIAKNWSIIADPNSKKDVSSGQFATNAFDLQLISWGDGSGVPTSGNSLVIVGIDNKGLLHIRIFDAGGNRVTDTDETKLPRTQAGAIATLKQQIPGLLPPHVLTDAETAQLISQVTSIVGLYIGSDDGRMTFADTGILYFVPEISASSTSPTDLGSGPPTATATFTADLFNSNGYTNSPTGALQINVTPGYTAMSLSVSLSTGLTGSNPLDVYKVQQRLLYLGFPDNNGNKLTVDGVMGPSTAWANGLFTAAASDPAGGVVATAQVSDPINLPNAPRWVEITDRPGVVPFDPATGQTPTARWTTSWANDLISAAVSKLGPPASFFDVSSASYVQGGNQAPYPAPDNLSGPGVGHQDGHGIDIDTPDSDIVYSDVAQQANLATSPIGDPFFAETQYNGNWYVLAKPYSLGQVVTRRFANAPDMPAIDTSYMSQFSSRGRNGVDIDSIVIHTTQTNVYPGDETRTVQEAISVFHETGNHPHYVISPSGIIYQLDDLNNRAPHATYYNDRSIGIEMIGMAQNRSTWTDDNMKALVQLVAWLAYRYNVLVEHPDGNALDYPLPPGNRFQSNPVEAGRVGTFLRAGLIGHNQIQPWNRTDPGQYFSWPELLSGVLAELGGYSYAVETPSGPDVWAHAVTVAEAWDNEPVLEDIKNLIDDNPTVGYNLATVRAELQAFSSAQTTDGTQASAIWFNDPRTWDIPKVSFKTGYSGHFHVEVSVPPASATVNTRGPISTASGFGTNPDLYYRFVLANGFEVAGQSTPGGDFSRILPPNVDYTLYVYQPSTNRSAVYVGHTNTSGRPTDVPPIILDQFGGPDSDGDGIPDVGEIAIGTDPNKWSTTGDGISDGAKLAEGLDPLDGRAFPTGIIASLPLQGTAQQVAVSGSTAYIATQGNGLAIVDVSQFNKPILLAQLTLPGNATDVAVASELGLVAVATNSGGLQIVDASTPLKPRLLHTVNIPASHVTVLDGLAYVASGSSLVSVDPISGETLQSLDLSGGTITGIAAEGSMLYTMTSGHQLQVVDTSSSTMILRGSINTPAGGGSMFVGNGIAYVADVNPSRGGYATVDVSNPDNPVLISGNSAPVLTAPSWGLVSNGSGLGLLIGNAPRGPGSVRILDVSNPSNTYNQLLEIPLPDHPYGINIASGIAFVADGSQGLQVIDYLPFDNKGVPPAVSISLPSSVIVGANGGTPEVVEGSSLPVLTTTSDDVQVGTVKLLINGQVVQNAVSFPFNLSAIAPSITESGGSFTIQVEAIDTGGNVGLSNTLALDVVPDTTSPRITSFSPPDGGSRLEGPLIIQVSFSKALAAGTVTAANFQLDDANGNPIPPSTMELRGDDRVVEAAYPPQLAGAYELVLNGPAVTDRIGNPVSSANVIDSFSLTPRETLTVNNPDADPTTPGLQLFEAAIVTGTVSVDPSVSVQSVKLLLNGQVISTSGTAPVDFSFIAPLLSAGSDRFTLQAQVTDSSGFTTTTESLTVGLLQDTTPPTLVGTDPPDGGTTLEGIQAVALTFSKPIATSGLTTGDFQLFEAGPSGAFDGTEVAIPIKGLEIVNFDTQIRLITAPLNFGVYRLSFAEDLITDLSGNALGSGKVTDTFTLTSRATLSVNNADADPNAPGLQLYEAVTVRGTISVDPSVSVQTVDLLLNSQVINTGGKAPFDFSFIAPLLAAGSDSFTLQAQVTDTSGYTTSTSLLVVGLLQDNTLPSVVGTDPPDGSSTVEGIQAVTITFSKPIATASLTTGDFQLFEAGPSGQFDGTQIPVPITGIQSVNDDTEIQLMTALLGPGLYQMSFAEAAVTDRVGHSLGTGKFVSTFTLQPLQLGNGSFETGDFEDWSLNPYYGCCVTTSWPGVNGTTFGPVDGSYFAVLAANFNLQSESISQQISVRAGDTISGWAFYVAGNAPTGDFGSVNVLSADGTTGVTLFIANDSTVGGAGQTPWTQWQYTFQTTGTYTINAAVFGILDNMSEQGGALGLDDIQLVQGQPQFLAGTPTVPAPGVTDLTPAQLQPVVTQAIAQLATAGYNVSGLGLVQFHVAALPAALLSLTYQNNVWIDPNAQGYGWYIDAAPGSNAAFTLVPGTHELEAAPGSPAYGHADLLTVVTHELGHVLGFGSVDPRKLGHDWMTATLGTGVRRLPDTTAGSGQRPWSDEKAISAYGRSPAGFVARPLPPAWGRVRVGGLGAPGVTQRTALVQEPGAEPPILGEVPPTLILPHEGGGDPHHQASPAAKGSSLPLPAHIVWIPERAFARRLPRFAIAGARKLRLNAGSIDRLSVNGRVSSPSR